MIIRPVGSYTTGVNVPIKNLEGSGFQLVINITTIGTGSVTVGVQGIDPASAVKYDLIRSAALVANAVTILRLGLGLIAVANLTVNDLLPMDIAVDIVHNNANAVVYSVGLNLTAT
jgi:hypothetical protein